jgi:hypothetical protein
VRVLERVSAKVGHPMKRNPLCGLTRGPAFSGCRCRGAKVELG